MIIFILFGIAILSALGIIIMDNYFDTFKYYHEAKQILSALGVIAIFCCYTLLYSLIKH
jgi:hypothetical protein